MTLAGLSVSEATGGSGDTINVTLSVGSGQGTLTLGTTTGLSGLTGNGSGTVTFSGLAGAVNTALGAVSYNPGEFEGSGTLTLAATSTEESGGTPSGSASHNATIESIALQGVHASSLTAGDFVFDQTPVTENPGSMSGQMTLINEGTIDATGTNPLVIDTGSNVVANSGTLEATGTGGLIVNSAVANSGLLWANGGNLEVNGAVSGSGTAKIDGSATLEFGAASSAATTFGANAAGELKLDHAIDFSGVVSVSERTTSSISSISCTAADRRRTTRPMRTAPAGRLPSQMERTRRTSSCWGSTRRSISRQHQTASLERS